MPRRPLESLGASVREKRGQKKLRETAREIGFGTATLTRVESGRIPDLETFGKICRWLAIDPGEFLGYETSPRKTPSAPHPTSTVTAHLKADRTPKAATVSAIAQMVLTAMASQPGLSDDEG